MNQKYVIYESKEKRNININYRGKLNEAWGLYGDCGDVHSGAQHKARLSHIYAKTQ